MVRNWTSPAVAALTLTFQGSDALAANVGSTGNVSTLPATVGWLAPSVLMYVSPSGMVAVTATLWSSPRDWLVTLMS